MPGFIDSTTTTANLIKKGADSIANAQQNIQGTAAKPAAQATSTVNALINGSNNGISRVTGAVGSVQATSSAILANGQAALTAVKNADKIAIAAASSIAQKYLGDAIKSVTGTFSLAKKDLATGISSKLTGIFKDVNIKSAADIPTKVSDPVNTNLLSSAKPESTAFKVESLVSGATAIAQQGSTSLFGSGADKMTGTTGVTLLNRFKLDDLANVGKTITSAFSASKIQGLVSNLTVTAGKEISKITGGGKTGSLLGQLTTIGLSGSLGVPVRANLSAALNTLTSSSTNPTTQAGGSITPDNTLSPELEAFLSQADSLGNAAGLDRTQLTEMFVEADPDATLVRDGVPVSTGGSGIDAGTANAILGVLRTAGCAALNSTNYQSSSLLASMFNLGLNFSAKNGLLAEVNALLGCSSATSSYGQQSLLQAFAGSSATQLTTSRAILGGINSPAILNTDTIRKSILINPNLTQSDLADVNEMFATIGSTPSVGVAIPGYDSGPYPVHDAVTIATAQPSFMNALFEDTTMTDVFAGSPMGYSDDGTINWI